MVEETESSEQAATINDLHERITRLEGDMVELKEELYAVLTPLMEGLKLQQRYNWELFDQFVDFGLKANHTERETEALKDENQQHYSQVHSNKNNNDYY